VSSCALLAEPDRALRDLMRRTLSAAGYDVVDSSNAFQLEVGLKGSTASAAPHALFVFGERLATQCAASILAVARERARVGLPQAQLILMYEFGSLVLPALQLTPCVIKGVLEKPFDLFDLQAMALECRKSNSAIG
jgi:hypothetical protein